MLRISHSMLENCQDHPQKHYLCHEFSFLRNSDRRSERYDARIFTVIPYLRYESSLIIAEYTANEIAGAVKLLHWPFTLGVPVAIMSHFDPENFCAYVQRYKATISLVVPPVLVVLARHPGKPSCIFNILKKCD